MQVGIVAQRGNDRAVSLADRLGETLRAAEVTVQFDETTAGRLGESDAAGALDGCDLVVSIGGDGTFLFAARQADATPVMGVNLGEVGFLNATSPDDAVDVVEREVERIRETGQPRVREVARLRVTGDGWDLPPALNEVVVQGPQRGHGNGADLVVRVDGSTYLESHADGLLVATPTGSTAYNLSEGGPLVHPSVRSLVVTGMCATDSMPPLVVDDDSTVTVEVTGAEEAFVISDGRAQQSIAPPATVEVAVARDPLRIAGPPVDFFEALGKLD